MIRNWTVTLLVFVAFGAGNAFADGPPWTHERDGVVLGFNLGAGSASLSSDDGTSDRETGGAANLRVAYAFRPDLALGGEVTVWTSDVNDVTWTFSVAGASLSWFPNGEGFFVRGGFGVGTIDAEVSAFGGTFSASETGLGLFGAVGHEWRLTRRFALGPQFDFSWMDVGDGLSANYINLTLGLNWYL